MFGKGKAQPKDAYEQPESAQVTHLDTLRQWAEQQGTTAYQVEKLLKENPGIDLEHYDPRLIGRYYR